MGNLLFSPSGRIGSGQFMSGATILVVLGMVMTLIPVFVPALAMLMLLGLVMYWCWIVLWVKRYHDGGKSGWMCLIPIISWVVLGSIVGAIVTKMFADPDKLAAVEDLTNSGDIMGALSLSMAGTTTLIGSIIGVVATAAVSYVIAMVFNNTIKHDAHDNQFGPEAGT